MKITSLLTPLLSRLFPTLTARIEGDNNTIIQNFSVHVTGTPGDIASSELLSKASPDSFPTVQPFLAVDTTNGDDRIEIKRINEYRTLANNGESTTALKLLENLKLEEPFKAGNVGARLEFNVGLIYHNIGELQRANSSFESAYELCPDDLRVQAGLALANLNKGENEIAFSSAERLLSQDGPHRNLAAIVLLHAASKLQRDVDLETYGFEPPFHAAVVAANLEYIRARRPEEYGGEIDKCVGQYPDNKAIASLWAFTILEDAKRNQAFLLGAKMPDPFETNIGKSAAILSNELEAALRHHPPNTLVLPMQANNAAVALRLAGRVTDAAKLLDKTLLLYPALSEELAQVRAALYLQEDKYTEAFTLVAPIKSRPELQITAAEIEAKLGKIDDAQARINEVLQLQLSDEMRLLALVTKARIGIFSRNREAVDVSLDELVADFKESPQVTIIKSAYSRAFDLISENERVEEAVGPDHHTIDSDRKLLASIGDAERWDFSTILETAVELSARRYYRECAELLRDKISFNKESPALYALAEACLRGGLGTLARDIQDQLAPEVKNSVFGWKFIVNVCQISGEVSKAVPFARKVFEHNPKSLSALETYANSLMRANDKSRLSRVVKSLSDHEMVGNLDEKQEYVKLLVHCDQLKRARAFAYQIFCENRNDNKAWMALSASVLVFGRRLNGPDDLDIEVVQEDAAFEVVRDNGDRRKFIIEGDSRLIHLREDNISPDHPIAKVAFGKREGEEIDWTIGKVGERAKIISVKHKVLEAFHFILKRFEEQFPEALGFKSVSVDSTNESGLDEVKDVLQERAEYAEMKAKEYELGSYPMALLGYHLGLDPIDTFLGLKHECGVALKTSTCTRRDQDKASAALVGARRSGIIADPVACYLIRRLHLEDPIKRRYGTIGVTQNTIDIFAERLEEAERLTLTEGEDGVKRTSSIAVYEGRLVLSQRTEDEIQSKIELIRGDLEWLRNACALLPALAQVDPDDTVIRFRNDLGGRFFDDVFAADGSGRVLVSDDLYARQWAEGLFGIPSAWMQAMLFDLEEAGIVAVDEVVLGTVHLLAAGEEALSLDADRLSHAAAMLQLGTLTFDEFKIFSSVLGQRGASMPDHVAVAASGLEKIWATSMSILLKERATSVVLRNLVRLQGGNAGIVLSDLEKLLINGNVKSYLYGWRTGHFLL